MQQHKRHPLAACVQGSEWVVKAASSALNPAALHAGLCPTHRCCSYAALAMSAHAMLRRALQRMKWHRLR